MDRENIRELLREIGVPASKIQEINGWVSCPCPLAPYLHETGKDSHPSFGIKINDGGPSGTNCFTCGPHGNISKFLKKLGRFTGENLNELVSTVYDEEVLGGRLPEWGEKKQQEDRLGEPIDENLIYTFESGIDHPYLKDRRVSKQTAELFGICFDPDDYGVERIVIPVRHIDERLYGFIGRAIGDRLPRVRDYFGLPKRLLLLGAYQAQETSARDLILVEGPFDCLRLWTLGYPAVASLHSNLTDAQARILREIADSVLVMFDNDVAGGKGRNIATNKLKHYMPVFKTAYPKGYKDPGELEGRHVKRMVDNRRMV